LVDGQLKGSIQIHAHFFESGNVQLHQSKNFDFTVGRERSKATVDTIVKLIEKAECDLQSKINDLYENEMPNRFFKALRRIQPVTRVKMVWNIGIVDMKRNLESAAIISSNK
jgi:capping protein alpha